MRLTRYLLALFLGLGLCAGPGLADTPGVGLKPDLRLLVDISGSMKTSDPDNLREPAIELIVRLLPEGSKAGIWVFGEDVRELVPHGVVDSAWRERAREAVPQIDNSGQRTNIPAAITSATYDLERLDPGYRTSIVLLTDGKVDVAESPMVNASSARRLLSATAPNLGATGIAVHTIALSNEADWPFLRALARSTSGIAEKAESPQALSSIFVQALEMVAPTARVPLSDSGFAIDDSVSEFTLLVFFGGARNRLELVDPDGARYSANSSEVDWYQNQQFALVTVASPSAGNWRVKAPDSASLRVNVISDLKLDVDPLPNSLPAGRQTELGLRLTEQGQVLTDAEVLAAFDLSVVITGPGGKQLSIPVSREYALPADGEYRIVIPPFDAPGRYQLVAQLQAQSLQRELPMYVEVVAPPEQPTLVTRGQQPPEDDFQAPLLWLGGVLALLLLAIWLHLRRRKRRKLEIWEKRARQLASNDSEPLEGVSADQ